MKIMMTVFGIAVLLVSTIGHADQDMVLTIKDHRFEPTTLVIPAHTKVKVTIDNQDATPEEFESYSLNREKVIAAKSKGIVYIGPLKPGTYSFMGEFHKDSAQGEVVVQ